jgi:hypothetical protein
MLEAVKKLEFWRICRDFFVDFKTHPLPQRPTRRFGRGWVLKDAEKDRQSRPNLYFFTAS